MLNPTKSGVCSILKLVKLMNRETKMGMTNIKKKKNRKGSSMA